MMKYLSASDTAAIAFLTRLPSWKKKITLKKLMKKRVIASKEAQRIARAVTSAG
jgi:hypothetical protein